MAGANGFYSPPTPLKVCQGPACTTHQFSVSRQALTLLPHQSLHAYWLYRVCACYDFIEGFLMCLKNCLMIGIMMPVGVSCLSTLSPLKKTHPKKQKKKSSSSSLGCSLLLPFKSVQSSSCQSELYHIRRGDIRHHVSPAEQPFHAPA